MQKKLSVDNSHEKLMIGTAQFGFKYGIANKIGVLSQAHVKKILDYAHKNSLNYLDTAKSYGKSEQVIGRYLKESGKEWKISTKINSIGKGVMKGFFDSKNNLTITPETVLAHSSNIYNDTKFQKKIKTLKNNGVKKVGVSVYTEDEIKSVMIQNIKPDIIQIPMNILDSKLYRFGIIDELHEQNIEIHARSVFLQGLFYLKDEEIFKRFPDIIPYTKKLKKIAARENLTLAELSLRWLISLKQINKVVIGIDCIDHLKSHIFTLKKKINSSIFKEALLVHFENKKILNPSAWQLST